MSARCDLLVIDDEPVVLQGVARICTSEGLSVDVVSSGRAGVERLEATAYRLILCDIMMGDLDGFEFLVEARRRGVRTPVIMATGNSTVQNAVRSLQSGAADYLAKPFTADELMAVVTRGLNLQALQAGGAAAPGAPRPCPSLFHRLGNVSWAVSEPVGTVLIGINDLFLRALPGIQSLELLGERAELVQGIGCATLTSSDGLAHAVLCPVGGQVIEVHAGLQAQPAAVAADPYGAGWLYRILPADLAYDFRQLATGPDCHLERNLSQSGGSS